MAGAVAILEYSHFGLNRSSDGLAIKEVRMKESQSIRVTRIRIGFVATVKLSVCGIAAALLAAGYGNGLSPSA